METDTGVKLGTNRYGKSRVRVAKVTRGADGTHTLRELSVDILAEGEFAASYLAGDNAAVLPTDTLKNTVYVLAAQHGIAGAEAFGALAGRFFLARNPAMRRVELILRETRWERLAAGGEPHPHAFRAPGGGQGMARVAVSRGAGMELSIEVESGVDGVCLLKTGGSGFAGFRRDELTTLAETDDRLLSTLLSARWRYAREPADYAAANAAALDAMLAVFAREFSPSVQTTLYQMGCAALGAVAEIASVTLRMPNRHYLPFDLTRFGLENRHEVFQPTDEPHGQIEATVERA